MPARLRASRRDLAFDVSPADPTIADGIDAADLAFAPRRRFQDLATACSTSKRSASREIR
jgi:hypothetical protein